MSYFYTPNYFSQSIFENINESNYKIIPPNMSPTKFKTIEFSGWEDVSIVFDDEQFSFIIDSASYFVNSFIERYKETHAFTLPEFIYQPPSKFGVKIATMEIEEYNFRMDEIRTKSLG